MVRGRCGIAVSWGLAALLVGLGTVARAAATPTPTPAGPAPVKVVTGADKAYTPLLRAHAGQALVEPKLRLDGRLEQVSPFGVDAGPTTFHPALDANVRVRAGLHVSSLRLFAPLFLSADVEGDAITGQLTDPARLDGTAMPTTGRTRSQMRKAEVTLSYKGIIGLSGGLMTSNWGLGLLANDGAHGWAPGSAAFNDPRGGDRVLRGMLFTGPITKANLMAVVAFDRVVDDSELLPGDRATEWIAALMYGYHKPNHAGLYFVARNQKSKDNLITHAFALDATGQGVIGLGAHGKLTLSAEGVGIWGTTELAPSTSYAKHNLLQLAGVARAKLDLGVAGAILDLFYTSGDDNLDDKTQTAFMANRDFFEGLYLYRYVMAAQTGRAPVTASDPNLAGTPPQGLGRYPTRGRISNTIGIFPRGWWRPIDGLEIYGGPLIAFSAVASADPLNTRLAGGAPRDALGGKPGGYLGTEFDLGLRYSALFNGTEFEVGAEGGVLLPGAALRDASGGLMRTVYGGRLLLGYRL